MSDLFRSALGYLSSGGNGPSGQASQGQGGSSGYNYNTPNPPSEEANAVGETIQFSQNGHRGRAVRITKLIAEGGFSYVFRGVDVATNEPVAVKKILAPDDEAKKSIAQEKEFMGQFQHEYIATYFGEFVRTSGRLQEHYLAMEYCPANLPTPPLRLQHTTQVFAQSCRAIKYLHDFGIVHRDIKLENILIGAEGFVKLVDFGSATMEKFYPSPDWSMSKRTIVEEQIAAKTTPMYRAPEMLDLWSNYPIDEHVDIWALGCLLFALNFGQHPFQDSNKLAITNANYAIPKNMSDSGPVVTLIRGLLKVDPTQRISFGQIFEVLQSIAECQNFSLYSPLPFKAEISPQNTGTGNAGIVNPLGCGGVAAQHSSNTPSSSTPQPSGGGGSLFSSIKGGAASLIKNIKEQSQQYLVTGVAPSSEPQRPPPPRPPPAQPQTQQSRPPPPRPPPSPIMQRREDHIEFENREYDAVMNRSQQRSPQPTRPAPPRPRPPSPKMEESSQQPQFHAPKVANLLDMSFDSEANRQPDLMNSNATKQQTNSNFTELEDLFGGAGNTNLPDDIFWSNSSEAKQEYPQKSSNLEDLLGDPISSVLGTSVPTTKMHVGNGTAFPSGFGMTSQTQNPPFLQPSAMPQSASFQNLQASSSDLGANLMGVTSGKLPKNSSSPNLLSDLILDDIMSIGSGFGFSGINLGPSTGATTTGGSSNPILNQPQQQSNSVKPNYNRTQIFDPPQEKKTLDDVFGDILNSQGFAANKNDAGRTINEMRKVEMLSNPNASPEQIKINVWREGKKKNIRALLSSLHTVTWDGCNWEETNMSQMITPAQVKKVYRKACLAIHPDKQMGEPWEELAKLLFVELNEAWAAFEQS